ncbi:MAG: prepilin-type N-terminal cleavage/methylation domain-containing protein [Thiotrichales bacterium]|nr:prepilin-type N-terminal cleavage/methylation domain-containing protein [Thiotrichales bacterium]
MQRLVTGKYNKRPLPASGEQSGFTLIELMVVLLVVGILLSAVSLSFRSSDQALTRQQANQIQALFLYAQDQATFTQRTQLVVADDQGLKLYHWRQGEWQADARVKAVSWPATFKVRWQQASPSVERDGLLANGWWILPQGEAQAGEIVWQQGQSSATEGVVWDTDLVFNQLSESSR